MTGMRTTVPTWADILAMALAKLGIRKHDRAVTKFVQLFPTDLTTPR